MSCVSLNESNAMETVRGAFELHFTEPPSATSTAPRETCEIAGGGGDPASAFSGFIRWLRPAEVPIHMLPSRSSEMAKLSVSFQISPSSCVKLRHICPS